jgi:hypothetical protein
MQRAALVTRGSSGIGLADGVRAPIPQVVIERVGSANGDVPLSGA